MGNGVTSAYIQFISRNWQCCICWTKLFVNRKCVHWIFTKSGARYTGGHYGLKMEGMEGPWSPSPIGSAAGNQGFELAREVEPILRNSSMSFVWDHIQIFMHGLSHLMVVSTSKYFLHYLLHSCMIGLLTAGPASMTLLQAVNWP